MANNEQVAPMAKTTLISGMTIAFEAIDPSTGLAVSGVKISNAAVYGDDGSGQAAVVEETAAPLEISAPLWAPLPVDLG